MAPSIRRAIQGSAAALVALVVVGFLPVTAEAVPGEPQPAFAGDGTLELANAERAVVSDPDGRIVVASAPFTSTATTVTVRRFTAGGMPDPSFSGDGELALAFSGLRLGAPVLFPQADGLLVALGTDAGFSVWALDDTGALIPTYGSGGLAVAPAPDANPSVAVPLAAVPVGTGLALVWSEGASSQVTLLGSSGLPLPSFGGDGTIAGPAVTKPVVARPAGGLILSSPEGLVPVAADGTVGAAVDVSSGGGLYDVVADQDHVLVAVQGASGTVLRRLTSSLQVDATYGTGGSVALAGDEARFRSAHGRWFVVSPKADAPSDASPTLGYRGRVWVTALDAGGALDATFGTAGVAVTQVVFSEATYLWGRSRPAVTVVPAPAGGIALGIIHTWTEASFSGTRRVEDVRQLTADGDAAGTFTPTVSTPSMVDGGDGGDTFLALANQSAPDGSSRLVRVELQRPDPPGVPGTPVVTSVDGASFTLGWAAASGAPERYVVSATEPGATAAAASVEVASPKRTATITVPRTGRPYRFDVYAVARNADGLRSAPTPYTLAPFATPSGFITQLAEDVPTWRTDPAYRAQAATAFGRHGELLNLLPEVAGEAGFQRDVDPVTRLYTAYFGRLPDPSGLRHWVAKRRSGTTVARISAQFATSSEFRRTYGTLSDRAFVDLVYRNVLGRAPDPAGLDYWAGRLTAGRTSRGHLMANFSESAEHVRALALTADVTRWYLLLLGRAPVPAELVPWEAPDASWLALVTGMLESPEYAARVG